VAFAPDGHTLATASADKTVILWDYNGLNRIRDKLVERACRIAGRGLTTEEWSTYVPGLPWADTCAGVR
jgi:WD40 repeat protein